MKFLTQIVLSLGALSVLSACTVLPAKEPATAESSKQQQMDTDAQPYTAQYSEKLAEQLVSSARVSFDDVKVGITNLVGVTSQYNDSSALSQVLSEQLMQELHRRDVTVLDFKTTDFIRVTSDGDFALTRDYLELDEIMPVTHVMVGTLSQHRKGVMVNARLVNINSKDVASVAQVFIPEHVVSQLNESGGTPIIRKAP